MTILSQITDLVNSQALPLKIDTIRATFYKNTITHKTKTKLSVLNKIAKKHGKRWQKLDKESKKALKISNRHEFKNLEIINIYALSDSSIFYATTKADNNDKQKAMIEFYGLSQYDKEPPPKGLINELLQAVNNITSVDLCFDSQTPFNINAIKELYSVTEYGNYAKTYYINQAELQTLQRCYFYDKGKKDILGTPLYRVEATANIYDYSTSNNFLITQKERLTLQLNESIKELSHIISLATTYPVANKPYKAKHNKRELRA
ncbi:MULTISPECIES: aspartate carbamoyltransferase [unclassified Campylobacter]|uniref:aspartate carbamoyltransferase n=1 Tax=unclassified Campylobacter TaxID=2593542 RepID=UPI003D3436ED